MNGVCSVKKPFPRDSMKRIDFYYFLTLLLVYLALFGVPKHKPLPPNPKDYASHPTKEQRTSHMLEFYDKGGNVTGVCTGTAIGPHAVLTAEHCTEGDDVRSVAIDTATEKHTLVAVAYDGRDHEILLITGTPFINITAVVEAKETTLGEEEVFYGVGGKVYPPVPKKGTVIDCYDPSDEDQQAGQFCFSNGPVPGDSGSAVFNTKGEVLGLVTYQTNDHTGIGFGLHFTPDVYKTAATFDGTIPQQKEMSLEDLMRQMFSGPEIKKPCNGGHNAN